MGRDDKSDWMAILATSVGSVYMVVAGLVLGFVAWLGAWIPPPGSFSYSMGELWSRGVLLTCGVRLRHELDESVRGDTTYIYMANHQSLFDIPVMMTTMPGPFRFMSKKSLFHLPFFGWAMKAAGTIGVDPMQPALDDKVMLNRLAEVS